MNIISSSIDTAENLFVSALKAHLRLIQKEHSGDPPNGINRALTDLGYMSVQEIADADATIIAEALRISMDKAGDIVLYCIELTVRGVKDEIEPSGNIMDSLDKEISHHLDALERGEQEHKKKILVKESVQKIQETIKMPEEGFVIIAEQKKRIEYIIDEFIAVFPACTGFALYNKRGEGILSIAKNGEARVTLANIHDSIPSIFWKISLRLEERDEYGWVSALPHLVWIEAIRDRSLKRQLSFIALFVFESKAHEGVGTATPTIKGIKKEIERIIYKIKNE